jgi:hypothetical protein
MTRRHGADLLGGEIFNVVREQEEADFVMTRIASGQHGTQFSGDFVFRRSIAKLPEALRSTSNITSFALHNVGHTASRGAVTFQSMVASSQAYSRTSSNSMRAPKGAVAAPASASSTRRLV